MGFTILTTCKKAKQAFDTITLARFGNSGLTTFDEIRLGNTFADVTTGVVEQPAVPEPSSLGLLSIFGIGMMVRRRRSAK